MEAGKTGTVAMKQTYKEIDKDDMVKRLQEILLNNVNDVPKMTNRKIYLAGPWFSEKANILYQYVTSIITHSFTYTCNNEIFIPKNAQNKTPKDAFDKNVKHIMNCDLLLALVDEKDVGTAWEIGMAEALNKQIILLGYDESTFLSHTNVMLAFTGKCLLIEDLFKFLTGQSVKFVEIKNSWEGKE